MASLVTAINEFWQEFCEIARDVVTPEFLRVQPKLRLVIVRDKEKFAWAYFLTVELDRFKDCQTTYPAWHIPRRAQIRVSRRLYNEAYEGLNLQIFCQYSRFETKLGHQPNTKNVRIWLAY